MPKPTGPQFKDIAEARSFVESLPDEGGPYASRKSPGFLNQTTTKALMKAVGIRQWPIEHPYEYREYSPGDQGSSYITKDEPLNTTQKRLHMGTLKRYLKGDVPEFDTISFAPEDEVPYNPDILYTDRGDRWIDEGHHRIVTSRLNEHSSIDVNAGSLYKRRRR